MKGDCKVTINIDHLLTSDENISQQKPTKLIGSIDQGTSSSRFMIFDNVGNVIASAQMEHKQIFPDGSDKVGWHEHNPNEIWRNVLTCINEALSELERAASTKNTNSLQFPKIISALGITNQRETLIAWNSKTGKPYYNAIVWDDTRTTGIASLISEGNIDRLRERTGLPLVSYFAGTKLRWLLENVPELRSDLLNEEMKNHVRFGTVDTWLVYNLTGHARAEEHSANEGGIFVTDVTNASRWLLMDLNTLCWDRELVDIVVGSPDIAFPIKSALPEIRSCSEIYGNVDDSCGVKSSLVRGVPIAGILGDQQSALFGQACFMAGDAKCTYGTGMFLMMNTGVGTPIPSKHGLLSTVAYKLGGADGETWYALEGSVSHSGSVIQWLRDQLQVIPDASESEKLACSTSSNDGMYFVPAFAGLFAPHWRSDARGCIVGLTATHTKHHVCRAALEASAYQALDLFDAIYKDSDTRLTSLKVDGGMTANSFLMQFQSDMIGVPVVLPKVSETTAIGAAFAAGLAVDVWHSLEDIKSIWSMEKTWESTMDPEDRASNIKGWGKAITRSYGWVEEESTEEIREETGSLLTKLNILAPVTAFIFGGCIGLLLSGKRMHV